MATAHRAALAVFFLAGPLHADYDPSQYPAYETCALCHGLFGVSHTAKFPNLAGQRPGYIEAQLHAFRSGARANDGGQMSSIVTELHPLDIPLVVEWFSTQAPPEPYPAEKTGIGADTVDLLGCTQCHTNTADGPADVPFLTAQHPGYLTKQMQDFRDGRRTSHESAALHGDILRVSDDTLEAIAAYLGAQERP